MGTGYRRLTAAVAALLLLLLTGCANPTAEDLYAPPQLSERYQRLQNSIDELLNSGAEYAPPASGSHRQSIQMDDLDGDGVGEILAFFNFLGSDKPLKIFIFRQTEDGYEEAAHIEGDGTGIDCISYTDMDGDGVKEIAVGWQIAVGIKLLTIYTIKQFHVSPVLSTDYAEYAVCDLRGNGRGDIVSMRLSSSELTGEATLYSLTSDGEIVTTVARLSTGTDALLRIRTTSLTDGRPAVLLESHISGGGFVTDILVLHGERLTNITLNEKSGVSESTLRGTEVYCRDINGDGVLDVPRPVAVPSVSETTYYRLEWYSYSSLGWSKLLANTYNNYSDGWYLVLPASWVDRIAIHRSDGVPGERSIVFSLLTDEGEVGDRFLVVYVLTGENRAERATHTGRFVLKTVDETIYAAEICQTSQPPGFPLTQELIGENFGIIYSEWITGET